MAVQSVKELTVYKKAYRQAMAYFITDKEHAEMTALNQEVGKMLGSMIANPSKFLLTPDS
jgi:hypothetical protein